MGTATHSRNGHTPPRTLTALAPDIYGTPHGQAISASERLDFSVAFSQTVLRCLFGVLPAVRVELAGWQARAEQIPNAQLRAHARGALLKRGNIEGAALFATLAPRRQRRRTVRALVAFQTAYNYLDTLSELPSEDPVANGDQLHQALLRALAPGADHLDYYRYNADQDDGGYLAAIVDECRSALAGLPSFEQIAPTARGAAARIVDFQALNLSEQQGGHDQLSSWASEETPPGSGLQWWETAAAAGSSLAVHALIAAAAAEGVDSWDAREIDRAYFPWPGALHSLLDSLVDREEDRLAGASSLLSYYRSPAETAIRLGTLSYRARGAVAQLPRHHTHRVIVTAMCSHYLSAPEARTPRALSANVSHALGVPLKIAALMFRIRRFLSTVAHVYV